jgi:transposase
VGFATPSRASSTSAGPVRSTGPFDRSAYRLRHRVECLINRCKQYRSLATRYEKLAESYRALWVIAFIILWL